MYRVEIVPSAIDELKSAPVFYRRMIKVAIDKLLPLEPNKITKNRKCLEGLAPGFEHEPPVWELRVQDWRIFYDIDEDAKTVIIRAIRRKYKGNTTEDIV